MIPQLDPDVLRAELDAICERRRNVFPDATDTQQADAGVKQNTSGWNTRVANLSEQFARAHQLRPFGVGFSGGGIRSATFNLGVLQGLAQHGLLKHIDYLSTVSGGGYIGSWLHGLIRNSCQGDVRRAETMLSPTANPVPAAPEDDPIAFLRRYSNYLAPSLGLFSADSWVIASIRIRNVLLNQIILASTLCAAVVGLLIVGFLKQAPTGSLSTFALAGSQTIAALATLAVAVSIAAKNLSAVRHRTFAVAANADGAGPRSMAERHASITAPLIFAAAWMLGCNGLADGWLWRSVVGLGMLALFFVFQTNGGFPDCYRDLRKGTVDPRVLTFWICFHVLWMTLTCAFLTTIALIGSWHLLAMGESQWMPWARTAFGPPLICACLIGGAGLLVSLMGADYPDASREWFARIVALVWLICTAWIALWIIALFGPYVLSWCFCNYSWTTISAVAVWAVTRVGAALVTKRGAAESGGIGVIAKRAMLTAIPPAFMAGYLLALATLVHVALVNVTGTARTDVYQPTAKNTPDLIARILTPVVRFERGYWLPLQWRGSTLLELCGAFFALTGIAWVSSRRFAINEFSLYNLSKNRLVRCYLGGANTRRRRPNPLTGFDPKDDFHLADINPLSGYTGPFAVINAAMNVNAGSELGQQERKAASFVFTPAFCGYERPLAGAKSYRPTRGYTSADGIHLGTAMAISGAAANPNTGSQTSAAMAFLLTVLDARLGYWIGNPRFERESQQSGPDFAWGYLFAELFAQTSADSRFVHVSDGGNFENLGLYELVRRRCRYIIVSDAEPDGNLTFDGLSGAIQKCRADFGVEITLDATRLRLTDGKSRVHAVAGTIRYPELEMGGSAGLCAGDMWNGAGDNARGWLLYLKSTLTGDEPADVLAYGSKHPEFPHEPTSDQLFTESQFESYRRLGLHIVRQVFDGVRVPGYGSSGMSDEMLRVFQDLTVRWYPPMPVTDETSTQLADAYTRLMRSLDRPELQEVAVELLDDAAAPAMSPTTVVTTAHRLFWIDAIQLMETVFAQFQLSLPPNRENPRNADWMRRFRRWVKNPTFHGVVWPTVRGDYNPIFQQFVEDLRSGRIDPERQTWPEVL